MVHGWPGSYWEFYKMIPMITKTNKGNNNNDDDLIDFEVVCPSIPGYGFSEAPHKPGRVIYLNYRYWRCAYT